MFVKRHVFLLYLQIDERIFVCTCINISFNVVCITRYNVMEIIYTHILYYDLYYVLLL